jgi:predicted ArsR family transcriptional regulator
MRQMLVEYLLAHPTISAEEAMNLVGCSQSVMLRTLQDLAVHHVVEREKSLTGIVRYGLTARMKTEYERGFLQ